jgi:DNA-binding CsgD family transcriptional regulator/tetratricopeptide (TPR) repeat protein
MRLTSSHFVGRVGELGELELAAREAAQRSAALVLLGGESGVGKTRLIDELERRLAAKGTLVLRGDAVEQGDGELPYAPLLSALRPLVREDHPVLASLGEGTRSQLAALLPGLEHAVGLPQENQDGAGQLRLFEALLELLHALSEIEPLALVLEDMHWADRSTRTFVSFLARSLRQERVMLVLTFRTDELHRRHPLRALIAELDRLGRTRRIELVAFDRAELTEALSDILGDSPDDELVTRLFDRSEGNPVYTEELLAAGLDGRGATPTSLRDAFLLRVERLSSDARRAARAVAAGRALDQATIAEVTEIHGDQLNAALREAIDEQVLVSSHDGLLLFRHALLREAVVDDLLPGERGELHLALARALERSSGVAAVDIERATSIAFHYAAAGDQPAALAATVEAALAARRVHAYAEVADLSDRALELWPRVDEAPTLVGFDHVELLSVAAEAHALSGDRARGEVLLEAALAELDAQSEQRRYASLLARLARLQWALNRGPLGLETAQRALSMLPEAEGGRDRALLLAWLARTLVLRGRFREAVRDGKQALAAAKAAGDLLAETEVLNTVGMALTALGQVDEGVARLRHAIKLAREADDIDSLSYAYANLADVLSLAGRSVSALEVAQEGLTAAPPRSSLHWLRLCVSEIEFELGDWVAARASLEAVPPQPSGVLRLFRELREADLALGEGSDELAASHLAEVQDLIAASSEPQWIGLYGALLAELRRRGRDLLGARAAVAASLDRLEVCTEDVMRIARVTAVGLHVEADIAQRARDLREKLQERDALARARIHMQRLRAAARDGGPVERAWAAFGAAELTRARGRSDAKAWRAATVCWEEIGRPYPAAVARWREVEALVEADDRAGAGDAARLALEAARSLGSRWLIAEVTTLCERARLALGADILVAEREDVGEDPFGLTPRERQVLVLVADGATNRQIGAALFMAEKTASVHVSRILGKLGVQSRTQAAAVAHRLDLTRRAV